MAAKVYLRVICAGPNELSIRHEDAISPILKDSPKGPCEFYFVKS